ncbi:MAG: RluA family pseudouridine synthase [Aquabacterium sp.]
MARRPPAPSSPLHAAGLQADAPFEATLTSEIDDEPDDEDGGSAWSGLSSLSAGAAEGRPQAQTRHFTVGESAHGQRLDAFLAAEVPEFSRSHLKTLVEDGCVQVDGKPLNSASRKVQAGQRIEVLLRPTAQSMAFVPEAMPLHIVHEDAHVLVINKPAGLVVHPAAGNWTGTLMNGLLAHHAGASELPRAGIVHRLDKDTSGLMVVGKTLQAVTALSRAIAARDVSRQYKALVHGVVPERFTVEASIGRDPSTRVRMAVVPSGKPARTDVERLIVGEWAAPDHGGREGARMPHRAFSGVWCTLHTGRTHQIRVHLSSRKHPLVADALYGGAPALGMTRQALHAARLAFAHPISGETLVFEAALPEDMASAWRLLEASSSVGPA